MLEFVDKDGQVITSAEWQKKFCDDSYRMVAKTTVGAREVSTIWLGMNHGWDSVPLYFETMTFPDCDIQERYGSLEEAERGHREVVRRIGGTV